MLEKIINKLIEEGIIDNNAIATLNKSGTTDGIVYVLSEGEEDK
jgi:hypothetical protein